MTRNAKELIIVLLSGAGVIAIMWGSFATREVGFTVVHQPNWTAIGIGIGAVVVCILLGILVKTRG